MRSMAFFVVTLLLAGCGDYSRNEAVLNGTDYEGLFRTLYPEHQLEHQRSNVSGGSWMNPAERDFFWIVHGEEPLPYAWLVQYANRIAQDMTSRGVNVMSCRNLSGITRSKASESGAADSFGARIIFSTGGSRGAVECRFTTVRIQDEPTAQGYLSVSVVEFR